MADQKVLGDPDRLVNDDTRAEEEQESRKGTDVGRGPTPEEEAAADRSRDSAERVEEPYREMTDKGAHVKGEVEIG